MRSSSDFNASLRHSQSPSGMTSRAATGYGRHPYVQGMSVSVPSASSYSASSSARSSPQHGTSSPNGTVLQAPPSLHQYYSAQAAPTSGAAAAYLQRTAISNAYSGGPRTSDDTVRACPSSTSLHKNLPSSPANSTCSSTNSSRSAVERSNSFKVVIRVRPPMPHELQGDRPFQNVIHVDPQGHVLTVSENLRPSTSNDGDLDDEAASIGYGSHMFSFDHVYDQHCTQSIVYENTAKAVVESSLEGYNATIFAYGQTGTGKTYTMEGFHSGMGSVEERGIIPRAIEQIFSHIQSNLSARCRFLVRASYLQIYNECISDLLQPDRTNLSIRENRRRGVYVEGLSEWVVRSPEEIYGLMERGGAMRATGSTKLNELSSRSHAVFIIIAEQSNTTYVDSNGNDVAPEEFMSLVNAYQAHHGGGNPSDTGRPLTGVNINNGLHPKLAAMVRQSFKVGKLNLVDLAGSERLRLSGATGKRLQESKKINQSLSALGNVISALTDARGRQHIPYRDSKLTRILGDSLGGNCKTTMMAMISPAQEAMAESVSTLKFANRAKHIKNEARVNEDLDQKSLLRKYERELKLLRAELEERSRNVVDKRRLLELEEQRRRAEEDKMAAIRALEERSLEFMREKEEKKRLEQRISALTSQMLMSKQGHSTPFAGLTSVEGEALNIEDPLIRAALKEHQDQIRHEYECRLADLEKERETIEEEKAQVDRYKQLLLKQRDIMIALTQRLNERDEQISALQDELDTYDRHHKELEEKLDEKTAHLIHLQRVAMERNASALGETDAELLKALDNWNGGLAPSAVIPASASTSGSGIPVEALITHKQYRPHPIDSITINDNNVNTFLLTESSGSSLLSAEEKIKELCGLVDVQAAEYQRIAKELEDVKSDKVSVEFQMQNKLTKLDKLVQIAQAKKELERFDGMETTQQVATLQLQVENLTYENKQLEVRAARDIHQSQLQARCETLVKERRAVQTIVERKIKALVMAIGEASDATVRSAGGVENLGDSAKCLVRETSSLEKLVNALIVALQNADTGSDSSMIPSGKLPQMESSSSKHTNTVVPTTDSSREHSDKRDSSRMMSEVKVTPAPPPPSSVDELIEQKRAQLQREQNYTQ